MTEKRTSIFENGLIWFGAGVSLAEILTGTYFASLGFGKGLLAIIIGHIIGCTMLFLAGVIGGKTRRSAMETVKIPPTIPPNTTKPSVRVALRNPGFSSRKMCCQKYADW